MSRVVRVFVWGACAALVLAFPSQASAQSSAQTTAPGRGYIKFSGDVAPKDSNQTHVSGSVGFRYSQYVQLFGQVDWLRSLVPVAEMSDVLTNASAVSTTRRQAVAVSARLGGYQGLVGARINVDVGTGRLAPYGEIGIGLARLESRMTVIAADGTDLSDEVLTTRLTGFLPQTDLVVSVGGGAALAVTKRLSFELGYRLSRLTTANGAPSIRTGNVSLGTRIRF